MWERFFYIKSLYRRRKWLLFKEIAFRSIIGFLRRAFFKLPHSFLFASLLTFQSISFHNPPLQMLIKFVYLFIKLFFHLFGFLLMLINHLLKNLVIMFLSFWRHLLLYFLSLVIKQPLFFIRLIIKASYYIRLRH